MLKSTPKDDFLKILLKGIALYLIFSAALLRGQIDKNGDFQIWNRYFFDIPIVTSLSSFTTIEFRYGDDASKLYLTYVQTQFLYKPFRWLKIGPGYRQYWQRSPLTSSHFEPGYSPLTDITFILRLASWEFRDRNRIQYIIFRSDPSYWLYRNRLRLIPPWSATRFQITPFIENEIFIRQGQGFHQNRTSTGFLFLMNKSIGGEVYYMLRFLKREPNWTYQNVVNIALLFNF